MMYAIVAADKNWGIGKDGDLLCHIPGDMKYFREKTMGATVVMGRKTLDSFPGGKPLPNRRNIVLTRSPEFERDGCEVVHGIDELSDLLNGEKNVFVIGGAEIYSMLIGRCSGAFVTKIDEAFDADRFFPDLDSDPGFELASESEPHEENGITYRFTEYRRK